jgi:prepilin-type N-terminal cleavage/methylation domain-containing protein/prepilin-type processing-associated H-X9-DG protein
MRRSFRSRTRRGFTLIELLVVIFITAVVIALLLPAVQAAREAANRLTCSANLKQLALACLTYHDSQGSFPPGAVGPIGTFPQYTQLKHHGLGTYLLPYLEQKPLYDQYRSDFSWFDPQNQTVVNTQLGVFQCPSAQQANRIEEGLLPTITPPLFYPFDGTAACGDYAGMGGVGGTLPSTGLIDEPSGPLNEIGHYDGVFAINRTSSLVSIQDGSSNTILIGECAGRPQLWRGHKPVPNRWVSGAGWASRNLLACRPFPVSEISSTGTCAVNCTNNREVYSFHPDGANVAFADGSVHFLKATINIRVFARLVTRVGGEIVSGSDF